MPASQPATRIPRVVGRACWVNVRATIGTDRVWSASVANVEASRVRSAPMRHATSDPTSISAVSRMSWLVAP
jgi:hypothetical protein